MRLSIFLSTLLIHTNGFFVPHLNKITHNNALAKHHDVSKLRTSLYAVKDEETTLENTARNLFYVYCNEDKLMDWKALIDVPSVKDLMVSYTLYLHYLICVASKQSNIYFSIHKFDWCLQSNPEST